MFVQVVADIATAAVPRSVLQHFRFGQVTPLAKPTGGHRQLLMMSFLRRVALKSIVAAKEESVVMCAGPLQRGVGCPRGANKMVKTITYFAEADPSRVFFALDLKAAFQIVSRRAMLHNIEQPDPDLAAVFSRWYTVSTKHRMHFEHSYAKISANSGVHQGCPLSACGFAAAIDLVARFVLAELRRLLHEGAKLLLTSTTLVHLDPVLLSTAATRSTNLELQTLQDSDMGSIMRRSHPS